MMESWTTDKKKKSLLGACPNPDFSKITLERLIVLMLSLSRFLPLKKSIETVPIDKQCRGAWTAEKMEIPPLSKQFSFSESLRLPKREFADNEGLFHTTLIRADFPSMLDMNLNLILLYNVL